MSYPTISPTKIARAAASLPDPNLPAPSLDAVGLEDRGFTAQDLIDRQATLERHAKEAIPFSTTECTWAMGYIRQPVYACKTCGGGGICSGCSIGCHAEHDLVELFNKRNFRCDCGTPSLCRKKLVDDAEAQPPPCNLRNPPFDPENEDNKYSHNFDGAFCYCERGKLYDPEAEEETMFQCIACEDWFHEGCTSLLPAGLTATTDVKLSGGDSAEKAVESEAVAPQPLFDHERFEHVLCNACVRGNENEILRRYAGARGWATILPADVVKGDSPSEDRPVYDKVMGIKATAKAGESERNFIILGLPPATFEESAATAEQATLELQTQEPPASSGARLDDSVPLSQKRPADDDEDQDKRTSKRARLHSGNAEATSAPPESMDASSTSESGHHNTKTCSLPPGHPAIMSPSQAISSLRLDVYLSEDFRDRICRCEECLPKIQKYPYLLGPEPTYSPPQSISPSEGSGGDGGGSTAGSSTYDLGLEALKRLPREKAIESLRAYEKMRDALWGHLRPFAASGEPVDEAAIRDFFDKQKGTE